MGALNNLALDYPPTMNERNHKVLPKQLRLLWGDGLKRRDITPICNALHSGGWSLENIATFGMGSGLHQDVNRDTNKFAMKCSWAVINGVERDVFKRTVGKASKAGKQGYGLPTVFENGMLGHHQTYQEIRARARAGMAY